MFGRKSKLRSTRIDTLIGQKSVFRGNLEFSGGLHVDGKVYGNVCAVENSNAVLILSEHGSIEGEVRVPTLLINGLVEGDVYSSTHVELASKARINGSLFYNLLQMNVGCEVNGGLVHQPDAVPKALEDKRPDSEKGSAEIKESAESA